MRGKFFYVPILILCVICLSSCTRIVNCPADELRMYAWSAKVDNGDSAELSFDGSNGLLSVHTGVSDLVLSGLCVMTDDRLIICDEKTDVNYTFGYVLYGDRVELTYYDGTISLEKTK